MVDNKHKEMKRALAVWGGWEGHYPLECVNKLMPLLSEQGFEVELSDTLEVYSDGEQLKEYDLIVQCWSTDSTQPLKHQLTTQQTASLKQAVESGVGLAGWHGGVLDSFRGNFDYLVLIGGQFICHPGDFTTYQVNVKDSKDPIMAGLSDFTLTNTEKYYMHVDPGNEVIATTTFDGKIYPWIDGVEMPVVWKRYWGQGRIFVASYGHDPSVFDVYEAREIMLRGFMWAAKSAVPVSAAKR